MAGWALFCNSRARPASKDLEDLNILNRPGHGTWFGSLIPEGIAVSEGYLQSKDLQKLDLFSIFQSSALRARKAVSRNTGISESRKRKTILLRAASRRSPFPDVEISWKFCGMPALTVSAPHDMFVGFRGQPDSLLWGFPKSSEPGLD